MLRTALSFILAGALLVPALPAVAGNGHCPPGLAKKAVPCVPPGLAKKGVRADDRDDGYYDTRARYRVGDLFIDRDGTIRIRDRDRYRLPRLGENEGYYRDGRIVYRVDEETRRVLELIRLAEIVLGN